MSLISAMANNEFWHHKRANFCPTYARRSSLSRFGEHCQGLPDGIPPDIDAEATCNLRSFWRTRGSNKYNFFGFGIHMRIRYTWNLPLIPLFPRNHRGSMQLLSGPLTRIDVLSPSARSSTCPHDRYAINLPRRKGPPKGG